MIIKVCGMREPENIRAVEQIGIDWMGFVFWPESPRFVQMIHSRAGIIPDYSSLPGEQFENVKRAPELPKRVGVFVDDMPQNIVTRVYNFKLDFVQLHGSENRAMIENLRHTLVPDIAPDVKIIKAISVSQAADIVKAREYEGAVDYFLFDTKCPTVGASGKHFDWSVLDAYDGDTPFLLSGGIGPDDVERILAFHHPKFVGIDINSRFETAPAVKDVEAICDFVQALRTSE